MDYSSFYKPVVLNLCNKYQVIYPLKGIESVLKIDSDEISTYLLKLLDTNPKLLDCQFQIMILWSDGKDVLTDVWMFKSIESEDSGYLIDCRNFRKFDEVHEDAITASDGISLLGKEAELAEVARKAGKSVEEYVNGERPKGNFIYS